MKPVLPSLVLLSLLPSLASADERAAEVKAVEARITEVLVEPLTAFEQERIRYSRARPPPKERHVRITRETPATDPSGRRFYTYAVDSRFGGTWLKDDVTGCAYVDGDVFVKKGATWRPAQFLLGKNVKPVPGVCVEAKDGLALVDK